MIKLLAKFICGVLDSSAALEARRQIIAATFEAFENHHVNEVFETHRLLGQFAERVYDQSSPTQAQCLREWKEHINTWLGGLRLG